MLAMERNAERGKPFGVHSAGDELVEVTTSGAEGLQGEARQTAEPMVQAAGHSGMRRQNSRGCSRRCRTTY